LADGESLRMGRDCGDGGLPGRFCVVRVPRAQASGCGEFCAIHPRWRAGMRPADRLTRIGAALALALAAGGALGACQHYNPPMNTLSTNSDLARWFTSLFMQVTIWDGIIMVIVLVALLLAIFVFSSREGEPGEPSEHESDLMLELAWTVGPALIL